MCVTHFFRNFFRLILKLLLATLGLVFLASLLVISAIALTYRLLKSLLTGKKAEPVATFSRFQKFSAGKVWPSAARSKAQRSHSGEPKIASDVVDVEVREIKK